MCGMIGLSACQKDKDPVNSNQPSEETFNQAEDNNDLKGESDQVNTDVTDALENYSTINGRVAVTNTQKKQICGCSIDSVGINTIRLVYDGETPCGNPSRTRGGKITIQLVKGVRWQNQGSVLKITLENYRVVRLSDQKSWTFNGIKYYTNVRGSNWLGFLLGTDSLLYRERAKDMVVTLTAGQQITYGVARTTTWKIVKSQDVADYIQFAAIGDTTINGFPNTDTWGNNRFGNSFTTNYASRLVSNTYCWVWRPVAGEIIHRTGGSVLTLTMGVNEAGNPDTRRCAYGWKLKWALAAGATGEKIFSY